MAWRGGDGNAAEIWPVGLTHSLDVTPSENRSPSSQAQVLAENTEARMIRVWVVGHPAGGVREYKGGGGER